MLTERDYRLLTACVDGELSAPERKDLERLLHRSAAARLTLAQLQRDALLLHDLTPHKLPDDFPQRLVRILSMDRAAPSRTGAGYGWRALRIGIGIAAAAMLLLAVGAIVLVSQDKKRRSGSQDDSLVQNSAPHQPPDASDASGSSSQGDERGSGTSIEAKNSEEPLLPPLPRLSEDIMLTRFDSPNIDPKMEMARPKAADAIHPEVQEMHGVKAADIHAAIKKGKVQAVRLDLPCKNGSTALHRVKNALAAGNINLVVEQVAEHRLKHSKLHTNFVVYLEDVTPEELTRFLERLAQEDQNPGSGKKVEAVFMGLAISRLDDATIRDFQELLGPYGKAVHLKTHAGSGSQERAKGSAKGNKRLGLALPYNPVRPQQRSPEIHEFLESRKQPRPDTLQAILVLYGI